VPPSSPISRATALILGVCAGDIRSRLIRLIPDAPAGSPADAIRALLAHRFSARTTEAVARAEWRDIVEGRSPLWANIPPDRKVGSFKCFVSPLIDLWQETIRGTSRLVLVHRLNAERV
jgi:hypothetical protein